MADADLALAYSPCPNDTFVFAAWTRGMLANAPTVRVVLGDIEALNVAARNGRHALTKVSYGAIPYLMDRYRILRSGGALGRGCGPLVVVRNDRAQALGPLADFKPHTRIAIPGEMTTAYLLLRLALQRPIDAIPMRFDAIVDAVSSGNVDAGLIIHESRFTYQDAGLVQVIDLGDWWEHETGEPIPLGAILGRRDLDDALLARVEAAIAASIDFAYANDAAVMPYVRAQSVEMDERIMRAHIALYVNEYTRDVSDKGIAAVAKLFEFAAGARLIPPGTKADFVPDYASLHNF